MVSLGSFKRYGYVLCCLLVPVIYGCGAAHVRTEVQATDLHQYDKVIVSTVDVHSQEEAAKDNEELQKEMTEWEAFARGELEGYVNESHYELISEEPSDGEAVLIIDLDVDLQYGNQALRYWVGFGAGKGSVNSVLTVVDSKTSEEKFKALSASDLSVGAFGGDMEGVLKANIRELVEQYPRAEEQAVN